MIDYEEYILNVLISKFQRSNARKTYEFKQKLYVYIKQDRELYSAFWSINRKILLMGTLKKLKSEGVIDYCHYQDNTEEPVEKFWLIPNMKAVKKAYALLGIEFSGDVLDELINEIDDSLRAISGNSDIAEYLKNLQSVMNQNRKVRRPFCDDVTINHDILSCLVFLALNNSEKLVRVMSTELYGDSKYFEKNIKSKVLSILKSIKGEPDVDADELLAERGIVKYPEILYFRGRISVETKNGIIDYSNEIHGSYINTRTLQDIQSISSLGISRVLFIENLANYVDYVERKYDPEELVIYHGGCYSPFKGVWFSFLYDSLTRAGCKLYQHWSDIDYGGFNIFVRLRDNIIPELKPYRMDIETLETYSDRSETFLDSGYKKLLEIQLADEKYSVFHKVIKYMLEHNVRLEQERIII